MVAVYVLYHAKLCMFTPRAAFGEAIPVEVASRDPQARQLPVKVPTQWKVNIIRSVAVKDLFSIGVQQQVRIVIAFDNTVIVPTACVLGRRPVDA